MIIHRSLFIVQDNQKMMLKFFTIGQFQAFCNYARKKYPDIKKYELVSNVKIHVRGEVVELFFHESHLS